jgi:membrane-bound metal-dependent hydrolase YbcI (DUF457 family)
MNKKGHVLNGVLLAVGLAFILTVQPMLDGVTLAEVQQTGTVVAELLIPVTLGALFPDVDTEFGKHRKTLHNLPVLALFVAFPFLFDNLHYVWVGVATHYVLDIVGSRRGIALFYPLSPQEYGFPTGVTTSSKYADAVTVVATVFELGVLAVVHVYVAALDTGLSSAMAAIGV